MADARTCVAERYRLEREIASGGMGAVWRGWDERLQRPVAIKKLHPQPWLPPAERHAAVERMMREARISARLRHPNAVQVFDVVADTDTPCLVMEYVPSRSLQQIVAENGPMPPKEVARIGTQVAAALAAAHRAGIVHRDVKPSNVLVTEDGSVKITDFGIAHAFDDITLTSTGMLTGTPAYLAPEVARGAPSDYASDVYALGATLYMAVEGRPPFSGDENPMAVLHRVATGQWEPPSHGGPLTPMLLMLMSADPSARPKMVDVAVDLLAVHPLGPDAAPEPAPQPWPEAKTDVLVPELPTSRIPPVRATEVLPVAAPPAAAQTPLPAPWRPRAWAPIVAALVVVGLGAAVAMILLNGSGGGGNAAAPPTPRVAPSTLHASSRSAAPTSSSGVPSTAASDRKPKRGGVPTSEELAGAIVQYFNLVPGNLDAGWARLTRHFQRTKAQDRQTYDHFWQTVSRVDVVNVKGHAPHGAYATLVYHYRDGKVVSQQTYFRLVQQDGLLKIDRESKDAHRALRLMRRRMRRARLSAWD